MTGEDRKVKKITTLTEEQKSRFPEWVSKWLKIGLSTERADFDAAESAGRACYRSAGLPEPIVVLRMGSPLAATIGGVYAVNLLQQVDQQVDQQVRQQVDQQVWQQVWQQVDQQVWQQVWQQVDQQVDQQVWQQVGQQVEQQVWQQVRQQVEQQVWQQVRQQVWQQVGQQVDQQVDQQVWQQVGQQVWQQVEQQVGQQVRQQVGQQVDQQVRQQVDQQVGQQVGQQVDQQVDQQVGQQVWQQVEQQVGQQVERWLDYRGTSLWAGWYSFVSFFRDVCGWQNDALDAYGHDEVLALSCGWSWWDGGVLSLSDRPAILALDNERRLHSEAGPAIRYPDGWSIYCWHGTNVPAHWIEDRASLDPNEVIKADNVEQRAAGAAICGWPKMLSVLKAKTINDSGSDDIGQLIEMKLPGLSEPGRFLKAKCPRNGIIVEGVPRISEIDGLPIETALAAQAWRVGDPQSEYQHPPQRT